MDIAHGLFTEFTFQSIILRILISSILSGVLGFDRLTKSKKAGVGLFIIIGVGATLTVMTSQFIDTYIAPTDIERLSAQVISGIGFIGAGVIVVTGFKKIQGLTTATGIWGAACIGIAVGVGFIFGAILTWLCIALILFFEKKWQNYYYAHINHMHIFVVFSSLKDFRRFYDTYQNKETQIVHFDIDKNYIPKKIATYIQINIPCNKSHEIIINEIANYKGAIWVEDI